MVKFNFKLKGNNISIDVIECKTFFQKMHGLMFRKKGKSLLFYFNKNSSEAIHSFFCVNFIAIWFNGNQIIDLKYIKPNQFYIRPKEKFDKLLEIPIYSKEFDRIRLLIKK